MNPMQSPNVGPGGADFGKREPPPKSGMKAFRLIWGPTAREIAVVQARTARAARRKAPLPWCRFLGEIAVEEV